MRWAFATGPLSRSLLSLAFVSAKPPRSVYQASTWTADSCTLTPRSKKSRGDFQKATRRVTPSTPSPIPRFSTRLCASSPLVAVAKTTSSAAPRVADCESTHGADASGIPQLSASPLGAQRSRLAPARCRSLFRTSRPMTFSTQRRLSRFVRERARRFQDDPQHVRRPLHGRPHRGRRDASARHEWIGARPRAPVGRPRSRILALTSFLSAWHGNTLPVAHRRGIASIKKYLLKSGAVRYRIWYLTPDNRSTDKGGFSTRAEAAAWIHDMEAGKMSGTFISNSALKTPMGRLIEDYVSLTAGLSRGAVAQRCSHADNSVLPHWKDWPVGRLTKRAVEEWIQHMSAASAGASTVQKAYQLLVSVVRRAVAANLIPSTPVRNVRLPRTWKARHPYLTYDEIAELAEAIDPRYRALISVLVVVPRYVGWCVRS